MIPKSLLKNMMLVNSDDRIKSVVVQRENWRLLAAAVSPKPRRREEKDGVPFEPAKTVGDGDGP